MKTQHNTLNFKKESIIELNDERLSEIEGGSILSIVALGASAVALWILLN